MGKKRRGRTCDAGNPDEDINVGIHSSYHRDPLIPKQKKSKIDRLRDEIRAASPGKALIVHESNHEIVIRRPMTYGSVNTPSLNSNSITSSINSCMSSNSPKFTSDADSLKVMKSRYQYYGRLDPREESSFLMPAHVLPAECYSWVTIEDIESKKQSSIITIFSIWNTMMGTSILSIPWAIDKSGFACGIVLLVLMAALCLYNAYLIVRSQKNIGLPGSLDMDFTDICKYYLGRFGEYTSFVLSLLSLLCATVVYWILMSNFLFNSVDFVYEKTTNRFNKSHPVPLNNGTFYDDVVCIIPQTNQTLTSAFFITHDEDGDLRRVYDPSFTAYDVNTSLVLGNEDSSDVIYRKVWNLNLTVPMFLVLLLLPLINIKSPTFFTKFNAFGTMSVLFLVSFVTYKASKWGFHLDFEGTDLYPPVALFKWSFPALSGMLSLAYFIHNCILSILRNQRRPENNGRDLTIAFFCVMATFTFIGVVFYSSFPLDKSCLSDNLLNNFVLSDTWAFLARIVLLLQMCTVFPLLSYIFRVQVLKTIFGSIHPGTKHVVIFNILLLSVCVCMAIFFPHIGNIIRYCGSICGLGYIFTLPSIILLLQLKENNQLHPVIIGLHVVMILLGVANCLSQFVI